MQPIRRHEQLSLSWISFSLKTLRLSPFGLAGVGFSLPGTPPVRKSANETVSSGRLSECVARVKAARVEFSTAVTIKGVAVLVTFSTKADSQLALPDCEELNGVEQFCKNCFTPFSFRSCGVFFKNSYVAH